MALTKHKLKKQMMEKTLNKAERGGGQREDDPKILPYYKLQTGEKMEVMLLPYEDGDLMKHFKKHGPNMGVGAVGSVDCIYHSRGESCPACAKGFSYVENGKGTPMSKKWMAKDYYVAQVVVVDAPFDVKPLEDGNEARIFYMPFAVMEKIKESYAEGIVEDPTDHIFVIKKTENQGGNASYANSFFRPKPAGQDIFDAFEGSTIEIHDLVKSDIQPKEASEEEITEWVEKADKALTEGASRESSSSNRRSSSDDEGKESKQKEKETETDKDEDDLPSRKEKAEEPEEKEEEEKPKASSGGNSLRERLRKSRGG